MPSHYLAKVTKIIQQEGTAELVNRVAKFSKRVIRWRIKQIRFTRVYSFHSIPQNNRVYTISVDDINYNIWGPHLKNFFQGPIPEGPVWKGDWDELKFEFKNEHAYRGLKQRFEHEKPWCDTDYYEWLTECWVHQHDEAVEQLKQYEELFENIKRNGYNHNYPIAVYIGRNGEFILHNGKHRLSIAKIVGINSIPVQIHAIHEEWQEIRDDIYNHGFSEEHEDLREHPDLQDIVN